MEGAEYHNPPPLIPILYGRLKAEPVHKIILSPFPPYPTDGAPTRPVGIVNFPLHLIFPLKSSFFVGVVPIPTLPVL